MNLIKTLDLELHGDERGSLIAFEAQKNIPFDIKRVYTIFNTQPGVSRGFHAHRNLKQIAVCLAGSCRFVLDDGTQRQEITLNNPLKGLIIDEWIWREMHDFTTDCVLMLIANQPYDEQDYIRDYQQFKTLVSTNP
ncbi:WxcM-like domain-containing protein [Thiomicrospira microaerophila]|uniref:sugar 3,4-ketoisomerase n=1 Tax=Thiomicrospira microaerophila TaxID=406020 RepID=UPI00200F285D|nr:FdtA/QdtA family cupin domain-containing protein [Thiomicrospira microaerophila]UQB42408.1 WxcM-like domain-containing protein [Thiomicrospira microaerophila]